jgi:hypothetical protein
MKLPQSAVFGLIAVPPMPAAEDAERRPAGGAAPVGAAGLAGKTPSALAAAGLLGIALAVVAAIALFASDTRAIGQAAAGRNASPTAANVAQP